MRITVLFLVVGLAGMASAEQRSTSDLSIRQNIEHRLAKISIRGVTVSAEDGNIILTGTVSSLREKNKAREEAWEANDLGGVYGELKVVQGVSDGQILDQVTRSIRQYVFFTILDDADIEVHGGIVTLTGSVTMLFKAGDFAELASRVTGVQEVRNRIEWLPVSSFETDLPYILARRIYGDPLFWNYAIQPNPPVHIIVRGGRVTLTGTVYSEVERRTAEAIVLETVGVLSCENKLRLDGDR